MAAGADTSGTRVALVDARDAPAHRPPPGLKPPPGDAGAALTTRHLRLSLSVGERAHAARALAQEAMFITMQEPEAEDRAKKLFSVLGA